MKSSSHSKRKGKEETLLTEPLPLPEVVADWHLLSPEPQQSEQVNHITFAVQSTKKALQVVDRFLREGPREEIVRFRPVWKQATKTGLRQTREGKWTEAWKWLMSLLLWDAYQHGNREQALESLHDWLEVDCAFFLRQWWVSNLIASWHRRGEGEKIRRLFEGRRGKRSLQHISETFRRDYSIVVVMEKHLLNCGYREACRRTAAELKTQHITPIVETAAIRRVYEKVPPLDPLRDASVYYAVKTLRARGCSEEKAEQKVAAFPEQYQLSGPLSPDLVHQICRRYVMHHPRRV